MYSSASSALLSSSAKKTVIEAPSISGMSSMPNESSLSSELSSPSLLSELAKLSSSYMCVHERIFIHTITYERTYRKASVAGNNIYR